MEKTKGSGFLKVTGILMIIGGGISIILSIIAVLGVAALVYISDGEASSAMLYASVALMVVSAVAQLVAGIIGVVNCKKPEKAGVCMAWGIIVAVLCIAGTILNSAGGGSFSILSLVLGLVLPILYIIGAVFNKK
ncbi:hypothetical protein B5F08_09925 [Anaeromassilibacillus sp. An172]|uniref:hypothetical protein n=1 Tax=Anaeromassilibacillus sp. An172 TaxID=1965570 RepID=UPI000B38D797|nr:hypothetical protein [Anaeromassilibacillus sp. An172]OUP76819.1 hypothetical protein B5F08_09925 [Anaeromassilibacillus sp. An172]